MNIHDGGDEYFRKALGRVFVITAAVGCCLFGAAGTAEWGKAWLFMGTYVLMLGTLSGAVFKNSPDLVKERLTSGEKAKSWDRVILALIALLPLAGIIMAGLEKRRGISWEITAVDAALMLVLMLAGNALTFLAMKANPFFSPHVRIQDDRGHKVISSGPYRFVRHPGYTGMIVYNLAAPVLLGSGGALAVGLILFVLLIIRTTLEDNILRRELPGYKEYSASVRYRLFPFIW